MAKQSFWRRELLARLAAERSYLLRQLWALPETTIITAEVADGRTAKDIIAHIGAWDSLTLSRIRLVGNGRVHLIEPLGVGEQRAAFNTELHRRYQNSSLKLALAFALRERSGLLYAFSQLSDEALERRVQLPWGEETSIRDWYSQRYQHDAHHAQQLETWRKTLPLPTKRQIGPKLVLRAILKATRKEFLALVDMFPEADRETRPVRGRWTLKDLVGHLADWNLIGTAGLRRLLVGDKSDWNEKIADLAAFDEKLMAKRRNQSWPQVWRDFQDARQALEALFQQYPEPFLGHELVTPWDKKMPAYFWLTIFFGHDHEHAIDLRQALNLVHWPERFMRHPLKKGERPA